MYLRGVEYLRVGGVPERCGVPEMGGVHERCGVPESVRRA